MARTISKSTPTIKPPTRYHCLCCNRFYNTAPSYFQSSHGEEFKYNNGFITVCNSCLDKIYAKILRACDDDELQAIRYMCIRFNWYFDFDYVNSLQPLDGQSLFKCFLDNRNKQRGVDDATYIDTLKRDSALGVNVNINNLAHDLQADEDIADDGNFEVTPEITERWGSHYTTAQYAELEKHYHMLHRYNPDCTGNQEVFIKNLCSLNLLQNEELQQETPDVDAVTKLMSQYQKIFSTSGLRLEEQKDDSATAQLGVTLSLISQYTPEEYYKNKKVFKDYTGIEEYVERNITRPVMNIVQGSNVRDPEYHVQGDGEGEMTS